MRELLKRTFGLYVQKLWLKAIDRAIDRYHKAQFRANREYHVMKALCKEYEKRYSEKIWRAENGK